jgi:hypothetical protein
MTHVNMDYFWPAFHYLLPWLLTMWAIGFLLRSFFDYGFFRFNFSLLRCARAALASVYLSVGLSLLFCWGIARGFLDLFGTEPLVTPEESFAITLLAGAFIGYALLGIASYVAVASISLLTEIASVCAQGVQWFIEKRAGRITRYGRPPGT